MHSVMEIEIIRSSDRGRTESEWLESRHLFSFGQYHNLQRINFGTLRVFNEDIVKPGKGFATHAHDNMEIVTIVLKGELKHKDNLGNEMILKKGDVQRMSAGSGIKHSEYNNSSTKKAHFLQIWVYPEERDMAPSYEQKHFTPKQLKNALFPIVSKIPEDRGLTIHQTATFFRADLDEGQGFVYTPVSKGNGDFLFVMGGEIALGDKVLKEGDTALISHPEQVQIEALCSSKILLIEVGLLTL